MDFQELAYLLSYEYRNVFLEVEVYAKKCQIHGWKYNRKMLHLFELLLSAQEKDERVDSIIGERAVKEFAKDYFNAYRWYDYLKATVHFSMFWVFTAWICEWVYPHNEISVQAYLRQILFLLLALFAGPISRKYSHGKVNWGIGIPIILAYVILTGLVSDFPLSKEQFFTLSLPVLVIYVGVNTFVYWNRRTVMKDIQTKYNHYLSQKQYAQLISHFQDGGRQTWQELVQRERKVLKNKKLKWVMLGAILVVAAIFVMLYAPLSNYFRWGILSLLLFGIDLLCEKIRFYEQKIKNMTSFEQEY